MTSTTPDRVRQALDAANAHEALGLIDQLPEAEQPDWLAEVWLLAGSHNALKPLLFQLTPAVRARAQAFLDDPPRRELPPVDSDDPYAVLEARAHELATRGLAAELAMTHLALSAYAPRSDWRALHVEHAASLAMGLGDPRLAALTRAYEAERDLDFGEIEEAREAADEALEAGHQWDEPRAVEMAERVLASLPREDDQP